MSQEKISAAQAAQVYSEVPGVLRALVTERDGLLEKNAALTARVVEFEKAERIEKIARSMEEKGIDIGTSFEDKVERVKTAAAKGRSLDVIAEAVDMSAPNGELAKLAEEQHGNGGSELEAFILGGIAD